MTLALMLVATIGAVALTERSVEHLPFAMAALLLNAALLLLFVADLDRAVLLSGLLALAIAGASIVKFKHSALKLTVPDVPLMFAGTIPFFASQYRSEEHTSELQSHVNLVCRLLLEKKKKIINTN